MIDNKIKFLTQLEESFVNNDFLRLKISKGVDERSITKSIVVKKIIVRDEDIFNYVYSNKTQDITKNYNLQECLFACDELIGNQFKNAVLFTRHQDITLSYNKKGIPKIIVSKATGTETQTSHNNTKKRLIDTNNNTYLEKLGIINSNGITVNGKVGKLKQIQKFIETLSSSINQSSLKDKETLKVADMGSGKGYLTFAVYDYIKHSLDKNVQVNGIEFRKDLVEKCNDIALDCCFDDLSFTQGTIQDTELSKNDILIALHACDTATDDAIYRGIISNSELIILSPCCHKQVRKEIKNDNTLSELLSHGIFKERQSEIITDTLRGLVLELHGYKTKIFEYIADEHTHKNTMIVGIKRGNLIDKVKEQEKIDKLKSMFGINNFYLEELLKD